MNTSMPSESITGAVGSIVGAVLIIVGAIWGTEVDAGVAGAITLLVSWLAFGITLWVRRTRATEVARVPEGTAPED